MAKKFGSEGSGIIWCHPGGTNCTTPKVTDESGGDNNARYFFHPKDGSEYFDEALYLLSDKMNGLVATTQGRERASGNRDAGLEIGFLQTINGYLPVWKRNVLDSERLEDLVDTRSLKPLGSMTDQEVKSHLQIESDGGSDGTWYAYEKSGGLIKCTGSGQGCFVTVASSNGFRESKVSNYFPKVASSSPVYDKSLSEMADKLNEVLNETQRNEFQLSKQPEPRREIGLAFEEDGIRVVWKSITRA